MDSNSCYLKFSIRSLHSPAPRRPRLRSAEKNRAVGELAYASLLPCWAGLIALRLYRPARPAGALLTESKNMKRGARVELSSRKIWVLGGVR